MKIVQSRRLTIQCKVLVVVAEHDGPAFHEQSKHYSNLLKETLIHSSLEYLELPGVDHFDMLERCEEKNFILNEVNTCHLVYADLF